MIKIICVGKIKEDFLKSAIDEYLKRISKYTKAIIKEVKDDNIIDESDRIKKCINEDDYVIALDIDGININSLELSNKIDTLYTTGNSNIAFIIGGSEGLHSDIKKRADYRLSFSKLTFPHQLFRVMLLEQIYRSFKIIKNESYHK